MALIMKPRDLPDYGSIDLVHGATWTLHFTPNDRGLENARLEPSFVEPSQPYLLARGDSAADTLEVYPRNVTSYRNLFEPKHGSLKTIRFEARGIGAAGDIEEAEWMLSQLPSGFLKTPAAGLGIEWELRSIIDTFENADVHTLDIKAGRHKDTPTLDNGTYTMTAKQFDELRRAVRRVHSRALGLANGEKLRTAHNVLLTAVDAATYPEEPPTYREGGVTAVIASRSGADLSPGDQAAVITAATAVVKPNVKKQRNALLRLSQEIETVTLRDLIAEYQKLLDAGVTENRWQTFFRDNPFVLRLAFGYPVIQMGDQVSVGGGGFEGVGNKIADFGVRAAMTGNLALIEIKTGETELLEPKPYRRNLYGPHRQLAGGVSQVLDQVYQVQKNMAQLKEASQDYGTEGFAVQALVIAGRTPTDRELKKSFEIYRHSLRAVTVITFDELLLKLTSLADYLETPSAGSPAPETPPTAESPDDGEAADPPAAVPKAKSG